MALTAEEVSEANEATEAADANGAAETGEILARLLPSAFK